MGWLVGIETPSIEEILAVNQHPYQSFISTAHIFLFLPPFFCAGSPADRLSTVEHGFCTFPGERIVQGIKQVILNISITLTEVYI